MKTQNYKISIGIALGMFLVSESLIAQVSTLGNSEISGDYVGWQISTGLNLDIVNEDPNPINFYTDAGIGGPGSLSNLRMFIEGRTGNVGIGPSVSLRDRLAY